MSLLRKYYLGLAIFFGLSGCYVAQQVLVHYSSTYAAVTENLFKPHMKVYKSCLAMMNSNVCTVMTGPGLERLAKTEQKVLIAGFGELDGDLYRRLRTNPLYMCEEIYKSCEQDKSDKLCRLAYAIY